MQKGFVMDKLKENEKREQEFGAALSKYQAYVQELTGFVPGKQLGPVEIYNISYKAALDAINESKSGIITNLNS